MGSNRNLKIQRCARIRLELVSKLVCVRSVASSWRLLRANQLAYGPELLIGRCSRVGFDGAAESDDALADGREHRAAALPAARLGSDCGSTQRLVDLLDQKPCTPIGHAKGACACRNRSGGPDRFQKSDFPWTNAAPTCEIDANRKAWTGHGARLLCKRSWKSRANLWNRQVR